MAKTSLSQGADGSVVFEMKRAYDDGTAALRFTPEELVSRLVAIVPPAGAHQIVYRGVLAGNAALRAEVIPKKEPAPGQPGLELGPLTKKAKGPGRRPRATWAQLVWRVFEIRGWHCPTCGAKMELRHVMEGGPTTQRVLAGLIRAAAPP